MDSFGIVIILFFCIVIPLFVVVCNHVADKNAEKKALPAKRECEKCPDDPGYVYSVMRGKEVQTMTAYEIRQALHFNIVKRYTHAWRPGMPGWQPLYAFPELGVAPPMPGCDLNEFPIAMIALFAIPYSVLTYFFSIDIPWWGWMIYNSVFACWDMAILEKSGYNDKKFFWILGFTLIPIYVICRACYTKRYRWIFVYFLSFVMACCADQYAAEQSSSVMPEKPRVQAEHKQYTAATKKEKSAVVPTEKPRDLANFYPEYDRIKVGDRFFYNPQSLALHVRYICGWVIYRGDSIVGELEKNRYQYLNDRPLVGKSYVCTAIKYGKAYFEEIE